MPKGVYKRKEGWVSPTSFKKGHTPAKKSKEGLEHLSAIHKGKRIWKVHPRGMFGKVSWTKGKSYHPGDKHWNWQGGKTALSYQIRHLFKYRQWRSDVFMRDNYICQICNKRGGGEMHADHIKKFSIILKENNIKTLQEAENCEELWNINNGRTLCRECHKKTETYGNNNKRR